MALGLNVPEPGAVCRDQNCPFHGELPVRGQTLEGTVASTDMDKTVIVAREYDVHVPKYDRYMKRRSRIPAHAPECLEISEGDTVVIAECRPLSKTKTHVVVQNKSTTEPERSTDSSDQLTSKPEQSTNDRTVSISELPDGSFEVVIEDTPICRLQHYDGFYGLYWESEYNAFQFLHGVREMFGQYIARRQADELLELVTSINQVEAHLQSDLASDSVIDGLVVEDELDEIRLSGHETLDLLAACRDEIATQDALEKLVSDQAQDASPNKSSTFIRINTKMFNISWEQGDSTNMIGLLKDTAISKTDTGFLFNSLTSSIDSTEKDMVTSKLNSNTPLNEQ